MHKRAEQTGATREVTTADVVALERQILKVGIEEARRRGLMDRYEEALQARARSKRRAA